MQKKQKMRFGAFAFFFFFFVAYQVSMSSHSLPGAETTMTQRRLVLGGRQDLPVGGIRHIAETTAANKVGMSSRIYVKTDVAELILLFWPGWLNSHVQFLVQFLVDTN